MQILHDADGYGVGKSKGETVTTCTHGWNWRDFGTCPACENDNQKNRAVPVSAEELARLRDERNTYLAELMNIGNAKRFDRQFFDDDSAFADWAQSRVRQHYPYFSNVTVTVKP